MVSERLFIPHATFFHSADGAAAGPGGGGHGPVSPGDGQDRARTANRLRERFLCIHGHFYQPPRENPWLNVVEEEPSAAPHHDWNARVTAECYRPNAAARVLNDRLEIFRIRNNYESISFNFGPTLLEYLADYQPDVYADILQADAHSAEQRGGHGNALAQSYNHSILPLCNRRDKTTQILWGMEDFRARFGRDPEGMWLPEAAVDTGTLEVLADNGILFTVLAPRQAQAWRPTDGSHPNWRSTASSGIDPTRPYACSLPGGRSMVLFFYDGPISQAVAFEGLLENGERFAARLLGGFSESRTWPQLMHIATDGESYGHHHRRGEMALAYAVQVIENSDAARLTNYGEYLAHHPPRCEVQVWDNSSWSCVHGVERWRSDCGCCSGGHDGWTQQWRAPLREAFDALDDDAARLFASEGEGLFHDAEAARNAYVALLLDRGASARRRFFDTHLAVPRTAEAEQRALELLEMQRLAMLTYTSCGWFFDEVSGLETQQTLRYAARLVQLLGSAMPHVEERFLRLLARAPSNLERFADAAGVYRTLVEPLLVDPARAMADYCIANFDHAQQGASSHYGFHIHESDCSITTYGDTRLRLARVAISEPHGATTTEATTAVLHLGGHDFQCKIGPPLSPREYQSTVEEVEQTFGHRSLADTIRLLDRRFGWQDYGFGDLFQDTRRRLLARLTGQVFERHNSTLVRLFDENRRFMEHLLGIHAPLPEGFIAVAEYVLRTRLNYEIDQFLADPGASEAASVAMEAKALGVDLVNESLLGKLERAVRRLFRELALGPTPQRCRAVHSFLDVVVLLRAGVDLSEAERIVFALVNGAPLPAVLAPLERAMPARMATPPPLLIDLARRLAIAPPPRPPEPARSAGETACDVDESTG